MRGAASTTIAAGLGLAALALLPVTASAAATLRPAPAPAPASAARGDRAAEGPVALRRTTVVQDGPSLVWRLTTAESWTSSDLRGGHGRRICVSSHRADGSEAFRSCVGWRGRRLVVRGAAVTADGTLGRWRTSAATVERRGQRTLVVRGRSRASGSRAGGCGGRPSRPGSATRTARPPAAATIAPRRGPGRRATRSGRRSWSAARRRRRGDPLRSRRGGLRA